MCTPPWSLLGEDWRLVFPPPVGHLNLAYFWDSKFGGVWSKRKIVPLSGSGALPPAMSGSPASPTHHALSIMLGSLKCVRGVLTIPIWFEP